MMRRLPLAVALCASVALAANTPLWQKKPMLDDAEIPASWGRCIAVTARSVGTSPVPQNLAYFEAEDGTIRVIELTDTLRLFQVIRRAP